MTTRVYDGLRLHPAPTVSFRYGVGFLRHGKVLPLEVSGNKGYARNGRLYVALDGQVWTAKEN